jgi:hypothetical protein
MQIDSESISYPYASGGYGTTISPLTRGYNSTTATTHADGSTVRFVVESEGLYDAVNAAGITSVTNWYTDLSRSYRKKGLAAGKTFGIASKRTPASGTHTFRADNPYVAIRPVRIV